MTTPCMPLAADELAAMRALCDEATPGPWSWGGHDNSWSSVHLEARVSGRPTVMGFQRRGMRSAEPMFWERTNLDPRSVAWEPSTWQPARDIIVREVSYRDDVVDLDNADARFIARSRAALPAALGEIDRQDQEIFLLRAALAGANLTI